MKKAKFITMFAALIAMGLSACGPKVDSSEQPSEPSSESSAAPSSSKPSSSKQSSAKPSSSSEAPKPHVHEWGEAQDVAAGEGTVAYKKFECKTGDAIKIEVKLEDSMLAEGSVNKNDPQGYLKLKANGQSWSFSFNYDEDATGLIYQRGVMDGWQYNSGKNIFSSGSEGGADDFELTVNDAKVDISKYKSKTFAEMMPGDAQEGNLSALTDVESGEIALKAGLNTVSYKRVASMNLALTHIVFVVAKKSSLDDKGFPVVLPYTWTEGEPVKNSEGKDCIPLTSGSKSGVKIKMTDTSTGSASFDGGKLPRSAGQPAIYHVKAPKAGNYQLVLKAKVSSSGDSYPFNDPNNDDRGVICKLNGVECDVFGLRLYSDAGLDHDNFKEFVLAQPLALRGPEQEDKIEFENPYYRMVFDMDSYLLLQEL